MLMKRKKKVVLKKRTKEKNILSFYPMKKKITNYL